ncbi:MAG TPA: sugar-binding protein [Aggregatilineaceae bacterium]|nr:sugar-binding protein [Aggregatilineaceae bacterium]
MRSGLINLDHLLFLTEPVMFGDRQVALVHIYSEYPNYQWVDAAGEGISAVDDVARAALVYLGYYEQTGDTQALDEARLCLEFVRYLQNADGTFYNFVLDRSGTINTEGNTSYKSLGWWAMRSLWALAEGYRVFAPIDPAYAAELRSSYRLTEMALAATLGNLGQYSQLHGYSIPAWIPGGAADVSSVALLALTAYYRADPNRDTQALIEPIADGIAAYRLGDATTYPFGMHPDTTNAPGYWHAWGSHQVHALAEAGAALHRQDWIDSAAAEANTFLMRQLAFEHIHEIGILPRRLGQIAYDTDMLVQGYMALFRATGDERYARYAGLAASWFFGNNMAGVPMYDPETGRCFDGINGPVEWRVNRNAGAESTIEALLALLAVNQSPVASRYLRYTQVDVRPYVVAEAEYGHKVAGRPDFRTRDWTGEAYFSGKQYYSLGAGDVIALDIDVPTSGDYWIYAAHQREATTSKDLQLVALHTTGPVAIDGTLDEWKDVPVFLANTARQFLRGVAIWRGPEVDSFDIQFLWDDENLYLAATVRDPVFEQPEIGPAVWQYDALWGYVDGSGGGQRLSSKFTLAQTPKGPQTWDWIAGTWVPNAELAWALFSAGDGYIYEAKLPFRSLRVDDPQPGKVIGFEAGRGIGGDSFFDLTGADPDTASNLAHLILISQLSDLEALGGAETVLSGGANAIALGVSLDDGPQLVVPSNTAPDRRYLWLDRVSTDPIHLAAGPHVLSVTYAGTEPNRRGAIDGLLIQPVVAQRVFEGPDGASLTLTYDTQTGEVTIGETTAK